MRIQFKSWPILILAVAAASLLAVSCQSPKPTPASHVVKDPWNGFGEPGEGKITIKVAGITQHPGSYHLVEGATLGSALSDAGGWPLPEERLRIVHLWRQNHVQKIIVSAKRKDKVNQFELKDGDEVHVFRVIY